MACCRACAAVIGAAEDWDCHHGPDHWVVATLLAAVVGHDPIGWEVVGWFVDDADSIIHELGPSGPWSIYRLPDLCGWDQWAINGRTFVLDPSGEGPMPLTPIEHSMLLYEITIEAEAAT